MATTVVIAALLALGILGNGFDSTLWERGTLHDSRCNIKAILVPRLSRAASVTFPEDDEFNMLLVRASSPRVRPMFSVVVEPATQADVQQTIKFANDCGIPFLTVNGGHGYQSTLNRATGIGINMQKLQQVALSKGGKTVHVGGGVKQKHLVDSLYQLGKQAVAGHCECTSVIGPLLGGGHSTLQGFHGYISDNLVSAQVVLANGSAVITSVKQHPDLFWALRGAGHNFGIITSFEVRAWELPKKKWTIVSLRFTQDKLESFVDALNEIDAGGDHIPELVLLGGIIRIPALDLQNPVIAYQVSYLGSLEEAMPYIERLRRVGPISETIATDVAYSNYSIATNSGLNSNPCRKDLNLVGYAISLPSYNKKAMRTGFSYFSELTADPLFNTSFWLLESYGSRGVFAQDYGTSAVPAEERDLPVLTAVATWWAGTSLEAQKKAEKYGLLIRAALAAGAFKNPKDPHVYLSYASGDESPEQVYGREKLRRLRVLKEKYDPLDRFQFGMPIRERSS